MDKITLDLFDHLGCSFYGQEFDTLLIVIQNGLHVGRPLTSRFSQLLDKMDFMWEGPLYFKIQLVVRQNELQVGRTIVPQDSVGSQTEWTSCGKDHCTSRFSWLLDKMDFM